MQGKKKQGAKEHRAPIKGRVGQRPGRLNKTTKKHTNAGRKVGAAEPGRGKPKLSNIQGMA